jgi:murein DD-endopeptidase MepM/ murein hydrolase activator NlpD
MTKIDLPRKRIALLIIPILLVSLSAPSAHAATKKAVPSTKKTTKTQVKGEVVTANSIKVVGNNTITTYTVKSGDTLSSIANKFDISVNTIRWSNDINSKDTIKPGEKLIILPTSGIIYTVKSGDTLSGIALKFSADQNDILNANDLDNADSIKAGMTLVIPDAEPTADDLSSGGTITQTAPEQVAPISTSPQSPSAVTPVITTPVTTTTTPTPSAPVSVMQTPGVTMIVTNPVTTSTYAITVSQPAAASVSYTIPADDIRGYYAQPISGRLSQGLHPVNAVDIAAPVGTTVHAAADGTVIVAMSNDEYNGGYGNYIVISHPNGTQTLYAHLSKVQVTLGEIVKQGEPIALSGATGKVTGPHLHFEIRGAANPWGSDPLGTIYSI